MLLDVVQEHLEETEILWSRRRTALQSPRLALAGLEALEARLSSHLDGLALGAREASGALVARLRGHDANESFAAAAALLLAPGRDLREQVLEALGSATPTSRVGIVEALCYLPLDREVERALVPMTASRNGRLAPAIAVLSFHRLLSPAAIAPVVGSEDVATRKAAARAIGRVGGEEAWILALVEDKDAGVRDTALAAAARRGHAWVLHRLRSLCRDQHRATPESIRLLACVGNQRDVETLTSLALRAELDEAALAGLATLGLVECVAPILECLAEERVARAAGEAFGRITGINVQARRGEPPRSEIEDGTFEDLRPLPDARALRELWRARAPRFAPGQRWRHGLALATERWAAAPHGGDLQTRREELTRLWANAPELFPTLELDAPASRQRMAA